MNQNAEKSENTDISGITHSDNSDKSAISALFERIRAQIRAQLEVAESLTAKPNVNAHRIPE